MPEPRAASRVGRVARGIARATGWAAGVFYELEPVGRPIPGGSVLVVANHPNALIDPLIVFRLAGRPVRPLAKAPLFEHPLIGPFLRGLGGLPVYRRQDDPALMHLNDRTFDAAISALRGGDAVQVFPEGTSHSEPSMAPLRTGAARIALQAEARADWALGLVVVPVGLTYARKTFFRSRALAAVGEAFPVTSFREAYERDPGEAARGLTECISRALESLTLNLTRLEDRDLIDAAERLYSHAKRTGESRGREGLGARLPRLQQFAHGLAWLRAHDPERHARLAAAVAEHRRLVERLGASDVDVPARYRARRVASYAIEQGLTLALGLPLAGLGIAFWYVPYLLPRLAMRFLPVAEDSVATYKLATALLAFPLAYAAWIVAATLYLGPVAGAATALLLPVLGCRQTCASSYAFCGTRGRTTGSSASARGSRTRSMPCVS